MSLRFLIFLIIRFFLTSGQQCTENINNQQNRLEDKEPTNQNFDDEISELINGQLSETMNSGLSLLGDEVI